MLGIDFYQFTSTGDRSVNQDCMAHHVHADYAVFVVADGLGGHRAGERASQFFCKGLMANAKKHQASIAADPRVAMQNWVADAVEMMRDLFGVDLDAVHAYTTCAILYFDHERVITAHCGDSRIYCLNSEEILWRTRDHSLTQMLVDEGRLDEWAMGSHPDQNRLTRSINPYRDVEVEVGLKSAMQPGETYVLCSDGFWESIRESDLLMLSQPESGKSQLKNMAQQAVVRARGRSDNCTVQWVRKRIID
jgi:PPM family protein phosphatase